MPEHVAQYIDPGIESSYPLGGMLPVIFLEFIIIKNAETERFKNGVYSKLSMRNSNVFSGNLQKGEKNPAMAYVQTSVSPANPSGSAWLNQSVLNGAPISRTTLVILSGNLIASLLFTITYIVEGLTRPGYDAWRLPVSALSLGPGGWVQQVNFVIFGLIFLGTVFAIRRVLKGGLGATWYPILQILGGISFIMLGLFSQDPALGYPPGVATPTTPTTHGMIHIVFSFVSFLTAASGNFVIARRLAKEPRWRGWATYAIITGLLTILSVALYGTTSSQHIEISGLFERLSGGVNSLWGLLFIVKLYGIHRVGLRGVFQQQQ